MGDHRFDGALPIARRRRREAREAELVAQQKELAPIVARRRPRRRQPRRRADPRRRHRARAALPARDPRLGVGPAPLRLVSLLRPARDRRRAALRHHPRRLRARGRAQEVVVAAARRAAAVPRRRAGGARAPARQAPHAQGLRSSRRIKANKGNLEFFENEVKPFVGDDAGEYARRRVAALEKLPDVPRDRAAPHADGDWRLGRRALRQEVPARAADEDDAGRADAARRGRLRRRARRSSTRVRASCTRSCGRRSRCRPRAPTPRRSRR